MIFDMKGSWQLPATVEPLFQSLGASVDVTPVMNGEDLQRGFKEAGMEHCVSAVGEDPRLLLSRFGFCHILRQESKTTPDLLSSVAKSLASIQITLKWLNWQTHQLTKPAV